MPGWSMFHTIHDPFLWRDEKINPVPWLVTKWEQVNPTTMRWYLRKGVKFHNGEDFTAESVKVSFEQYSATNSRSPWRSQLNVASSRRPSTTATCSAGASSRPSPISSWASTSIR
ncbi:MAG: ABC transporter substrate-binding protein [Candidatus Rokuibacteriota bacterium]